MDGFLMDESMYRQIILEHFKYPKNKVPAPIEGYETLEGFNPSCGDKVTIFVKVENNKISDIKFSGSGCSICCASASIMTEELVNLEVEKAIKKIDMFRLMVTKKENIENFEEAQAFVGVFAFPARFKCAFLSWDTLKKIIQGAK